MRKWLLLIAGVLVFAGSAYAVRHYGLERLGIPNLLASAESASPQPEKQAATTGQDDGKPAAPVEVSPATLVKLSDDIAAIGTLLAEESVSIAPETSGRIAEILFSEGNTVAAGATLFKLDADLANAALAEARARLALADANYGRNQRLRKSGNVAQTTYDEALTELEVARTAVETAGVQLRKLTITAPFAGTLGFRAVSSGAYVTAGTALVQLDKVDRLRVSFSVPELEQARIAPGQKVEVAADALPGDTFEATVAAIEPSVDVNGRALKVRADLDNAALKLRPGLLVRVTVRGQQRDAVMVPEAAIVRRGENAFVYVATAQTAKQSKVRLGKRVPGAVEILDGVSAGSDVIVAGNTRLADGAAVDIVASPAPAE